MAKSRVVEHPGPQTRHDVYEADARALSFIGTESVHFVCTSPPYGSLKKYPDHADQLGNMPPMRSSVPDTLED